MKRLTDREVLILELIFCGLPLVYYLLRLPFMPETVPVHWNASGEADRFAGRFYVRHGTHQRYRLLRAAVRNRTEKDDMFRLQIGVGAEHADGGADNEMDAGVHVPAVHWYGV